VADHHLIRGCSIGRPIGPQDVLERPCEVLIPAACEAQVTADHAGRLDCKLIVEAANGPTTPAADAILAARGIGVVPDVLASAGGVVISYFEWVQDIQRYAWTTDQFNTRLRSHMKEGLDRVVEKAEHLRIDWRTAALAVAVERVADAARSRYIYP